MMHSSEFERNLEKYAEVIVKVGLNLQPGQRLFVRGRGSGAPIEAVALVRQIAVKAYQAGARFVDVAFGDDQLTVLRFQNAPRDSFEEVQTWLYDNGVAYAQRGDALLSISGTDPDLLAGQDAELLATF